jgi:hypothetical protein
MVVGLHCHKKQQKVKRLLEEFSVLETLYNMVTKKEMKGPNGFEKVVEVLREVESST